LSAGTPKRLKALARTVFLGGDDGRGCINRSACEIPPGAQLESYTVTRNAVPPSSRTR
jgi:hypothetical protein